MQKIRLTATYTIEYEPDPIDYDGQKTIEEMADIDLVNFKSNPGSWIDYVTPTAYSSGHVEAKYEIIGDALIRGERERR